MKRKLLLLVLIVISITLIGCNSNDNKSEYEGKIVNFVYEYGSYNGGYYKYSVTTLDNKKIFKATGQNGVDLNIEKEIDDAELDKLAKIINSNGIYEWNGFDKSDKNVMDGSSFSLKVEYDDGKTLTAHGYMKYPKNYDNGHRELTKYLESIK